MSGIQIPGFNGPMAQPQPQLTPDQQKVVGLAIAAGKLAHDIYAAAAAREIYQKCTSSEYDMHFEEMARESHRAARAFFSLQDAPQGD